VRRQIISFSPPHLWRGHWGSFNLHIRVASSFLLYRRTDRRRCFLVCSLLGLQGVGLFATLLNLNLPVLCRLRIYRINILRVRSARTLVLCVCACVYARADGCMCARAKSKQHAMIKSHYIIYWGSKVTTSLIILRVHARTQLRSKRSVAGSELLGEPKAPATITLAPFTLPASHASGHRQRWHSPVLIPFRTPGVEPPLEVLARQWTHFHWNAATYHSWPPPPLPTSPNSDEHKERKLEGKTSPVWWRVLSARVADPLLKVGWGDPLTKFGASQFGEAIWAQTDPKSKKLSRRESHSPG